MKIRTFPEVNENPFKKQGRKDLSLEYILMNENKNKFFKNETTAIILRSEEYRNRMPCLTLIPSTKIRTFKKKGLSKKVRSIDAISSTLNFDLFRQEAQFGDFYGWSGALNTSDFVKVSDDIMTKMIRYVLSQNFIKSQDYSKPHKKETLLFDEGSSVTKFIVGRHYRENVTLEVCYDPETKIFNLGVLNDALQPEIIYSLTEPIERHLVYFERENHQGHYTLCYAGSFNEYSHLTQEMNQGQRMSEDMKIKLKIQERTESLENYLSEKKSPFAGEVNTALGEVKFPKKGFGEKYFLLGRKLAYKNFGL